LWLKRAWKKREFHLNYHQKRSENNSSNENLWNKKVCSDCLLGIFDLNKKILCLSPPWLIFISTKKAV
jgi:hypothetical protein